MCPSTKSYSCHRPKTRRQYTDWCQSDCLKKATVWNLWPFFVFEMGKLELKDDAADDVDAVQVVRDARVVTTEEGVAVGGV